jgi:hypothetical protein
MKGWTIMACHGYDHVLQWVMSVAICVMQSEDADSQCLLCDNLMKNHGMSGINFKGFIKVRDRFCAHGIGMCMIGTIHNVVLYKPTIPLVWRVKMATNLTTTEVLMLNDGNFFYWRH